MCAFNLLYRVCYSIIYNIYSFIFESAVLASIYKMLAIPSSLLCVPSLLSFHTLPVLLTFSSNVPSSLEFQGNLRANHSSLLRDFLFLCLDQSPPLNDNFSSWLITPLYLYSRRSWDDFKVDVNGLLAAPVKGEPNCTRGVNGKEALILGVMQVQDCLLHIDPSGSALASHTPSPARPLSVDFTSSGLFLHNLWSS